MGKPKQRTQTTQTGSSTARQQYDPFITAASEDAVGRALRIADRDYTPYTGNRIAALSGNERQGIRQAATGYGESRDYFRRGAVGFNEAFRRGDIDPYMENLANPVIREINRDYETQRQAIEGRRAQLNAFGNDRADLRLGVLRRNYDERVDDTRRAAFDRAIGVFGADQNRLMQAGGALADVQGREVRDLMETGYVDRVLRQAQSDFDYGQFLEARDWDVNNLMPLLQTLSAVPKNVTNTSNFRSETDSTTTVTPDRFGQVLGAAATVAGAYFTGGASLLTEAGQNATGSAFSSMAPIQANSPTAAELFPMQTPGGG